MLHVKINPTIFINYLFCNVSDLLCYIRKGARISKSIIFEYTRIGAASIVKDSVAFGRFFVDKDGKQFESEDMHLDWITDSRIPSDRLNGG